MAALIGIQGGTFDPIHYGHLRPALEVMQSLGLEQVRFIPNHLPPHRDTPWLDGVTRQQLVELAIADVDGFVLDDRELKRPGPSYMVETLTELRRDFPDHSLCLILGMDAYAGLTRWHQWQAILELCHLIITTRPGAAEVDFGEYQGMIEQRITRQVSELRQSQQGKILLQSVTLLDISATMIRQNLSKGQSIRYLVPEQVREKLENQYAI